MRITPRMLSRSTELVGVPSGAFPVSDIQKERRGPPLERFVPRYEEPNHSDVEKLSKFINGADGKLLVITGAGISTESGLPDYRSEGVGLYATSDRRPIQHMTFVKSESARRSYWARNFVGWQKWSSSLPNGAHLQLAAWEREKIVHHIITQNVDQLHFKAGSSKVLELHGTNSVVGCLSCNYKVLRQALQPVLLELNPQLAYKFDKIDGLRPDGDVDLTPEEVGEFKIPSCPKCLTGLLKPCVVFFGDNVPKDRVMMTKTLLSQSKSVLIIGSSLHVFSGYRIVLQAKDEHKPVAILNIGPTRADHLADLKISTVAGQVLRKVTLT